MRTVGAVTLVHHTKNKGDLGVAKAHADLVEQGLVVLFPSTEHAPFDLVAYDGLAFIRVQVKYRTARRGAVTVHLRSAWSDLNGLHTKALDRGQVDVIAVYCPDTDACYYIRAGACGQSVTVRVAPSLNNQVTGVLDAADCRSARLPGEPAAT